MTGSPRIFQLISSSLAAIPNSVSGARWMQAGTPQPGWWMATRERLLKPTQEGCSVRSIIRYSSVDRRRVFGLSQRRSRNSFPPSTHASIPANSRHRRGSQDTKQHRRPNSGSPSVRDRRTRLECRRDRVHRSGPPPGTGSPPDALHRRHRIVRVVRAGHRDRDARRTSVQPGSPMLSSLRGQCGHGRHTKSLSGATGSAGKT